MGTEASWFLRFSRTEQQTFLVRPEIAPQLQDALYIDPEWTLEFIPEGDFVRAVFTRKARS